MSNFVDNGTIFGGVKLDHLVDAVVVVARRWLKKRDRVKREVAGQILWSAKNGWIETEDDIEGSFDPIDDYLWGADRMQRARKKFLSEVKSEVENEL